MQELQSRLAERGVVWLTINSNRTAPEDAEALAAAASRDVPSTALLPDRDDAQGQLCGAKTIPEMLVIHDGAVVYHGAIDYVRLPRIANDRMRRDEEPTERGGGSHHRVTRGRRGRGPTNAAATTRGAKAPNSYRATRGRRFHFTSRMTAVWTSLDQGTVLYMRRRR